MVFVVVRHEISVGGERRAARGTRHRLSRAVRRAGARQTGASPPPSRIAGAPSAPGPVELFRYSALTFNSHRIHYDRDYATGVEGYPGLVVHGPLIATLLVDNFLRWSPQAPIAGSSIAQNRRCSMERGSTSARRRRRTAPGYGRRPRAHRSRWKATCLSSASSVLTESLTTSSPRRRGSSVVGPCGGKLDPRFSRG